MYGGLFGDLPSTKKSQSSDKNKETTSTLSGGAPPSSSQQQPGNQEQKNDEAASKKRPASLVEKLGTAGTTMAFVPVALRNRKRVNSTSVPATKAPAKSVPATTTTLLQKTIEPSDTIVSTVIEQNTVVAHIHDNVPANELAVVDQEEESDTMRQLHASVVDPYDPHVPNDLLAYWDRKAMERERLELEREAKETLKRQEQLRQQLEQERQALEKSGNLAEIVQHRQRTSMGRGRGVSNLPAWLVQKQQEEALGKGAPNEAVAADKTKPECTVILSNLTAPGSIDEDLGDEVREECEERCGPVTSVIVKDAKLPYQPVVQVHVEFSNRAIAEKAVRVFHGRKFGQRRITAELMQQ